MTQGSLPEEKKKQEKKKIAKWEKKILLIDTFLELLDLYILETW